MPLNVRRACDQRVNVEPHLREFLYVGENLVVYVHPPLHVGLAREAAVSTNAVDARGDSRQVFAVSFDLRDSRGPVGVVR